MCFGTGGDPGDFVILCAFQLHWCSALDVKSGSWTSQESESIFFEDRLVPCFSEEGCLGSKIPFPSLSESHRQTIYTDLCSRTKEFDFCGAQGIFWSGKHTLQSFREGPRLFMKFSLATWLEQIRRVVPSHRQTTCLGISVFLITGSR